MFIIIIIIIIITNTFPENFDFTATVFNGNVISDFQPELFCLSGSMKDSDSKDPKSQGQQS
jgi:hypothetical protein